jgi:hypothetical protein
MRTLLIILMLAGPAFGQVRTWTIATGVYTADAELVAVRGDMAYLKIGDTVESVPLARLSAADLEYIRSLSLAPVRTELGPGGADANTLPTPPGPTMGSTAAPPSGPVITEEAIPLPPVPQTGQGTRNPTTRANTTGRSAAVRGNSTSAYRTTNTPARSATNTTARRVVTPSYQLQSAPRGNSDPNPGILGIRERRAERQRSR